MNDEPLPKPPRVPVTGDFVAESRAKQVAEDEADASPHYGKAAVYLRAIKEFSA